jgi:hypothetical protein
MHSLSDTLSHRRVEIFVGLLLVLLALALFLLVSAHLGGVPQPRSPLAATAIEYALIAAL